LRRENLEAVRMGMKMNVKGRRGRGIPKKK